MTDEELIRSDEREQIALVLRAWAESVLRTDQPPSDYEVGYQRGLQKASRIAAGEDDS